ncbi:MAG: glycosyltransferase family 4 protein [Thermoanaerobaculia bacterium]
MIVYVSDALNERQHGGVSRSGFEFLLMLLTHYSDVAVLSTSAVGRRPMEFVGKPVRAIVREFVVKRDNPMPKAHIRDVAKWVAKLVLDLRKASTVPLSSARKHQCGPVRIFVNSFSTLYSRLDLKGVPVSERVCIVRGSPESFRWQGSGDPEERVRNAAEFLDEFDTLIFVSDICRAKWKPLLVREHATYYLPNSIDEDEVERCRNVDATTLRDRLGLARARFHVVMVGSVQRRKGQEFLASVLDQMIDSREEVQVHLVGVVSNAHGGEEVRRALATHIAAGRVVLHGHRENALEFVQAADIALFTSRGEAFPRAVAEYMALGKPILSTNVSGIPEMIDDGVSGLLYDPDDAAEFVARFRILAADGRMREALGQKAREKYFARFAKMHQLEAASEMFRAMDERLLGPHTEVTHA